MHLMLWDEDVLYQMHSFCPVKGAAPWGVEEARLDCLSGVCT